MATAKGTEWVELVGGVSTLLAGSWAIRLTGAAGLGVPGPSTGSDLKYAEEDGEDPYPRFRGPTAVSLSLLLDGHFDQDGVVVADPAANALTLYDTVTAWPDANSRECTIEWHRPDATLSAVARFETFGQWERHGDRAWEVDLFLTVPSGTWTAA